MRRLYTVESFRSKILNCLFSFLFIFTITFLLLAITTSQVQAQGFGIRKMKVSLSEKLPPAVYPVGVDVLVNITSRSGIEPQYLQQMRNNLQTLLHRFDLRLNLVRDKPETVLSCEILQMQTTSRSGTESRSVYKKVGEHAVIDETTGAYQNVEDFAYVMENFDVTIIEGRASLRYEIRDEFSGKTLEASILTTNFKQAYETGVPPVSAAYKTMTDNLTQMVAFRFRPTFKSLIFVNAPKGKLEGASDLLKRGLWNSAIEELKRVQKFKKPEDDAYRLYAFGLAYEGLAYETVDLASSKNYLEEAVTFYNQASRQNFDEADISQAALRTLRLLKSYKRLESAIVAYENNRQKKGLKVIETKKIQSHFGSTKIITNDTVIDWVKSGIAEKDIQKRIETSPDKYFDLSLSGIADLTRAGVKASAIDAMRRTMNPVQVRRKSTYQWVSDVYTYALILSPLWLR
jgi:tetratricopeptide (TPR) repeat protein